MKTLILVHVAATLLMTGVIWMVQVVHYPLFNRVGEDAFRAYEAAHTGMITMLVFPLMAVEALTALSLALQPPPNIPTWVVWLGLALVGVAWLMTAFVHVPQHGRLALGFDEATYAALVTSNWIRTLAWSVRSVIVLYIVDKLIATV